MRSVHESPLAYSRYPYSSRSSPEMDPSFGPEQFSRPFPPIIFSLLRVYFYDSITLPQKVTKAQKKASPVLLSGSDVMTYEEK